MIRQTFIVALRLGRSRCGSSAVEVALVAPLLCGMLFCGVDLANGFASRLRLEQAAGRTAELATAPGTVAASYSNLQAEGALASGQPSSNVVVNFWQECNGILQPNTSTVCPNGQQSARYISVSITKLYTPFFNWEGWIANGTAGMAGVNITGDATVRLQ